jgi:hypothetical protein
MTVQEYNTMRRRECDLITTSLFHVNIPVTNLLFDDVETSEHSYAVLFESGSDTYALIVAEKGFEHTLGDVRAIVRSMGLKAQRYFPPAADPTYFYNEGVHHFLQAYPARKQWKPEDIHFYESLAEYSPALIRIASIDKEVRRFNTHTHSWQKAFDYTYRKIQVA